MSCLDLPLRPYHGEVIVADCVAMRVLVVVDSGSKAGAVGVLNTAMSASYEMIFRCLLFGRSRMSGLSVARVAGWFLIPDPTD